MVARITSKRGAQRSTNPDRAAHDAQREIEPPSAARDIRDHKRQNHAENRGADAIEKKATMETYWLPGVNHLGTYGRWAFAELTDVFDINSGVAALIGEKVIGG